jgi:hypothetical protein
MLEELLNADCENARAEINLLDLVKLHNADFFFSAKKKKDTATVHYKKYNQEKLEQRVLILIEVEEILYPEKIKSEENKKRFSEKVAKEKIENAKTYNEIKKVSALSGVKPCYKIISEEQLEKLKNTNIKFAYFSKQEKFNICFLKSDEQKINETLFSKEVAQKENKDEIKKGNKL